MNRLFARVDYNLELVASLHDADAPFANEIFSARFELAESYFKRALGAHPEGQPLPATLTELCRR
jgi:hypothetical protein